MGNFDPLVAAIRMRQTNRRVLTALAFNWVILIALLGSPLHFF